MNDLDRLPRAARRPRQPRQPRRPRRRELALLAALVLGSALVAHAKAPDAVPAPPPVGQAARIDLVFALDTTGSMSGLIEGAKQKIWSIASELMSAQPTPEIRIGLVAYRDRGDAYVTRRLDLTDDIDAVWAELQQLRADGGGDGPESVNQALHEAVTRLGWSRSPSVYKAVFLVGDAPPHMDYANEVQYPETLRVAREAGIVINTVQCGSIPDTARVWRTIASGGGGHYAAIAQDGAMHAMLSPVDDELAELNRELAGTVMAYGDAEAREEVRAKRGLALAASPAVAASRLDYLSKSGGRANLGARDLVDAVKEGLVDVKTLPEAELPEDLRGLGKAEREERVRARLAEREAIQKRIDGLVQERESWRRAELERLAAEGKDDAFDLEVLESVRRQAAEKGLRWK